jgi:predicted small metal-binding protein
MAAPTSADKSNAVVTSSSTMPKTACRRPLLWEVYMAKVFECGSVVPGGESVVHGEDESESMIKAVEHMRSTHEFEQISEQLVTRIHSVIKDQWPRKYGAVTGTSRMGHLRRWPHFGDRSLQPPSPAADLPRIQCARRHARQAPPKARSTWPCGQAGHVPRCRREPSARSVHGRASGRSKLSSRSRLSATICPS